jgi:hypothetical protein
VWVPAKELSTVGMRVRTRADLMAASRVAMLAVCWVANLVVKMVDWTAVLRADRLVVCWVCLMAVLTVGCWAARMA